MLEALRRSGDLRGTRCRRITETHRHFDARGDHLKSIGGSETTPSTAAYPADMGSFPAPPPFRVETHVEATEWLEPLLLPHGDWPPRVGFIVPSGLDAYARLLHPGRRVFGPSIEQASAALVEDRGSSRQDDASRGPARGAHRQARRVRLRAL